MPKTSRSTIEHDLQTMAEYFPLGRSFRDIKVSHLGVERIFLRVFRPPGEHPSNTTPLEPFTHSFSYSKPRPKNEEHLHIDSTRSVGSCTSRRGRSGSGASRPEHQSIRRKELVRVINLRGDVRTYMRLYSFISPTYAKFGKSALLDVVGAGLTHF